MTVSLNLYIPAMFHTLFLSVKKHQKAKRVTEVCKIFENKTAKCIKAYPSKEKKKVIRQLSKLVDETLNFFIGCSMNTRDSLHTIFKLAKFLHEEKKIDIMDDPGVHAAMIDIDTAFTDEAREEFANYDEWNESIHSFSEDVLTFLYENNLYTLATPSGDMV